MTAPTQHDLFEITLELTRIDRRLAEIRATIELPPDVDEMGEDLVPHDVNTHLSGVIGCVRSDLIEDAIATLKQASEITAAELRAKHQRCWAN